MEDCCSSTDPNTQIPSTKKPKRRHKYYLRSCPESNFGGQFSSIELQMAQERSERLFICYLNVQIAKCEQGSTFSANHWIALTKSLHMSKKIMMAKLKKFREEAFLFKQILAEEHVTYNHGTGILSLPSYFWNDDINKVKYGDYKKERMNFKTLNEWRCIFDTKKLILDDDTRSVNTTKRQRNEVMAESSKKSKSSLDCEAMEMNKLHELQQCDTIFTKWKSSGYISVGAVIKLHDKLKATGDANFFLGLELIEDRWFYATEILRQVSVAANTNIADYILKDLDEDLVD